MHTRKDTQNREREENARAVHMSALCESVRKNEYDGL